VKNRISDLRNHLFETIEALKDPEKPMDVDRARAISEVSQTIINTAKVELQAMEMLGAEKPSGFFDEKKPELVPPAQAALAGRRTA
jgi:hypothetical protein